MTPIYWRMLYISHCKQLANKPNNPYTMLLQTIYTPTGTVELYRTPNGYQLNRFDQSGWLLSSETFEDMPDVETFISQP